jgi:hypothetical protein
LAEGAKVLLQFEYLLAGLLLFLRLLLLLVSLQQEGVLPLLLFEHFSNKYKRICTLPPHAISHRQARLYSLINYRPE